MKHLKPLNEKARLLDEAQRTVQATLERANAITSGHRACQGCGEALGARYAVDTAMRCSNNQLVAVNATGCLGSSKL